MSKISFSKATFLQTFAKLLHQTNEVFSPLYTKYGFIYIEYNIIYIIIFLGVLGTVQTTKIFAPVTL